MSKQLLMVFETDEQRDDFTEWFADAGGEQQFYQFQLDQEQKPLVNDLFFENQKVTQINFKIPTQN